MNRRTFLAGCGVGLGVSLILAYPRLTSAANILNYIESIRRAAPVVYVGTVTEVQLMSRTSFDVQARAVVRILAVGRGQRPASGLASLHYSTYDDQTPPNDGGLQYMLASGATILAFASSFDDGSPSSLWQGTPNEIRGVIESLSANLKSMSSENLAFEGITKEDRATQLSLYDTLLVSLRGPGQ